MNKLFFAACILFTLYSCISSYQGEVSQSLPSKNYQYQEMVSVKVKKTYFIDLINTKNTTLLLQAKKELFLMHPLDSNQELINYSFDYKKRISPYTFGVWNEELILSADKISYVPDSVTEKYSQKYREQLFTLKEKDKNKLFSFGDTVIFDNNINSSVQSRSSIYKFISQYSETLVNVEYINEQGISQLKRMRINDLITKKPEYKGYKLNSIVNIKTNKNDYSEAIVVGFMTEYLLIFKGGIVEQIEYSKIIN